MADDFSTLPERIRQIGAGLHENELVRFLKTKNIDQINAFAVRQSLISLPKLISLPTSYKKVFFETSLLLFRGNITSTMIVFDKSIELISTAKMIQIATNKAVEAKLLASSVTSRNATTTVIANTTDQAAAAAAITARNATTAAFDISYMMKDNSAKVLLQRQLLIVKSPYISEWESQKTHLLKADPNFGFFTRWYEARLRGDPIDVALDRKIVLIPPALWEGDVHALLREVKRIEDEHNALPADISPIKKAIADAPLQSEVQKGRLELVETPQELAEFTGDKELLGERLDDLEEVFKRYHNQHPILLAELTRYRTHFDVLTFDHGVNKLWNYGNAIERYVRNHPQNAHDKEYVALDQTLLFALDNVIVSQAIIFMKSDSVRKQLANVDDYLKSQEKIDGIARGSILPKAALTLAKAENIFSPEIETVLKGLAAFGEKLPLQTKAEVATSLGFIQSAIAAIAKAAVTGVIGNAVTDAIKGDYAVPRVLYTAVMTLLSLADTSTTFAALAQSLPTIFGYLESLMRIYVHK
jgi:hypothetical protein